MMWVIDTSAMIRLYVPDGPLHSEVETAFNRAASGADLVLAPQLLLAEAANVLLRKRRRGELSAQELGELLQAVESLPIRLCEHAPLILSACAMSVASASTASSRVAHEHMKRAPPPMKVWNTQPAPGGRLAWVFC
ncbi:MAG: type II toxin-antitoxin system VapC family toxin [Rhodocyclaceae bacterium]|nr:type II toxin-antitoxin system VapC family toxin [Rhodocyclaceae bacterium]